MDIKLGYQIYSAREEAEKDLGAVCAKLKEFGYDGVEFAGFYGYTAEQINEILNKTGLTAVSSHVPYQTIIADMAGTIAFHKAIGCKFIAVPYLDEETRPGAPGFAAAIRNIHQFGLMCKAEGIQLLYHNHDFEFTKVGDEYQRSSRRLHPQVCGPLPHRPPEGLHRRQEGRRSALCPHQRGRFRRREGCFRAGARL